MTQIAEKSCSIFILNHKKMATTYLRQPILIKGNVNYKFVIMD